MRLCGLVTLFQFPSLQNAWALTELSIKKCINLECCDVIANLSSITALRLSELDGLRRLPTLSKLTNLVLLDVNNSWHINNLPQVITDLEAIRRLRVTLERGKKWRNSFSADYETASEIFGAILSSLRAWPKQHLRETTLALIICRKSKTAMHHTWPDPEGPRHLSEYCMEQQKLVAFASSQHGRLGSNSCAQQLNDNLLKTIANIVSGATEEMTRWQQNEKREQQAVDSTDITIKAPMGRQWKLPLSLRHSTIKQLKYWILTEIGLPQNVMNTKAEQLHVYYDQGTSAA